MGYYCTVPQCTSLAGKTKNVKFHRFPRDSTMADKWNLILKRGKPYTKYSKVCSLHFTQADYNVTAMGQWKTLSKDAVPSQNLPKLNPDGTVMVIRKSRTVKYKEGRKDDSVSDIVKVDKWCVNSQPTMPITSTPDRIISSNDTSDSNTAPAENSWVSAEQETQSKKDLNNTHVKISVEALPALPPAQVRPGANSSGDIQVKRPRRRRRLAAYPDHHTRVLRLEEDKKELVYRLQALNAIANNVSPHQQQPSDNQSQNHVTSLRPKKQDAYMQTDPIKSEDDETVPNISYSESSEKSFSSDHLETYTVPISYQNAAETYESQLKNYELPKDYTKTNDDYIPQTNEEYNKEAEKYALERKSLNGYEKPAMDALYQKPVIENGYQKSPDVYVYNDKQEFSNRNDNYIEYTNGYPDSAEILRNQQHNLQLLQEPHRITENQNFFNENHIKQEIDFGTEDDKFLYERSKDQLDPNTLYNEGQRRLEQQRLVEHLQHQVKQEPDVNSGCENVIQPQGSPYYQGNGHNITTGYYEQISRPGPELLIAKQNALAAHTQLWQNTMKRPFFYSESSPYTGPQVLHRYEDITRILQ